MGDQPKTIVVRCPACASRLKASEELIGKRTKCPKCKQPITIPGPSPSAKEAAAPPAKSTTPQPRAATEPAVPSDDETALPTTAPLIWTAPGSRTMTTPIC